MGWKWNPIFAMREAQLRWWHRSPFSPWQKSQVFLSLTPALGFRAFLLVLKRLALPRFQIIPQVYTVNP